MCSMENERKKRVTNSNIQNVLKITNKESFSNKFKFVKLVVQKWQLTKS